MNLYETKSIECISASNKYIEITKTSRIPRLLTNFMVNINENTKSINKIKFWQKFGDLNLNAKRSRIPVLQSKQYFENNSICDKLSQKQLNNSLSVLTNSDSNDSCFELSLKSTINENISTNVWTQTQSKPTNDCLKRILEILRSSLTPDNKFRAIKRYRDKRLGIIAMDSYSDNTFDDRVREWVDSGYISNNVSVGPNDDVFSSSEQRFDAPVNTSNPVINRLAMASRRRSHNNMRAMDLIALNSRYNSFNSDISMSSISSIESLLESRREDPEELLLALGFGFVPEDQTFNRIPQRFFESPSMAKGVNCDVFCNNPSLKDISSLSSSASFQSTDFRERSHSCGRITDRFHKRLNSKDSLMKDLPEIITSSCSSLLQSPQTESILNPANRRFLESQGKDENKNQLSSKRLIIGTKSYKLDIDGDPLAFPKTPSPQATTPVPTDSETGETSQTNEQNVFNKNGFLSQTSKRKPIQRQNYVFDQYLSDANPGSALIDKSSEMSSSTTTLVGTVISGSNETPIDSNDFESEDKSNSFAQTEGDLCQRNGNQAIEAALVVAIQSLRLSLEFYKYQSLKLAKISSQKYNESSDLTEDDMFSVSKINQLRECIHKEIVDMDLILNRHLQSLHTSDVIDVSFVSQAQVFTEAVKKIKQLLAEQQHLYTRMGVIQTQNH